MTTHHRNRLHALQILGCSLGISIPLAACATLVHVANTGRMPFMATGAFPLVLLAVASVLACWIWTETVELA